MSIVAIYAKDWAIYPDTLNRRFGFDVIRGWIFGLLLSEDDEKIVIAHEWFPKDDEFRHTSVIPKICIAQRLDYEFKEQDNGEEKE